MTDAEGSELLAGLTRAQREAVTTRVSRLCVLAGPGSGKTRVVTRRIAWQTEQGHHDPRRVLAVTFSRRAARELRSRLRSLGLHDTVRAGTFHAIALAQLRDHAEKNRQRPPRISESRVGLLTELSPLMDRSFAAQATAEIDWAKARLVAPADYLSAAAEHRRPLRRADAARAAEAYADYEEGKRKRGLLDFDDVLHEARRLMLNVPEHAAAQRWTHQHVLVDEFQDINPLQFELLKSWIGEQTTLVAVGDPDQAIYGWNGADPDLINGIGEHFDDCAVLHLRTNFRSTPEILAAAGRVMQRAPQPAVRPSADEPEITVCDGADEAYVLALAARRRHRPGAPWRRQAVLARTNAQLAPLRQALKRHGVPVAARGDRTLVHRLEVASLLREWPARARLAACVHDARERLWRLSGPDAAEPAAPRPQRAIETASRDAARGDLEDFLDFARGYLALDPTATVECLVAALRDGDAPSRGADGVELLTFHAAKGLEWPVVHLVGVEEGYLPISRARTAAAIAEERRLLHVAMTRARQQLHVMWCRTRAKGHEIAERAPSRWLKEIAGPTSGSQAGPVDHLAGMARARQALRAARD